MDQTLTKSCVIFFLMDNLWVLRSWGKSLLYVYYCWRTTFLFLPSLRCSSFCWQRSPSADVSPPWNTAAHNEYARKKIVFLKKYEYTRTKSYTHWETSAMCLCLRLTHRSSSSWRRTSFSRESPIPLVSYLGRTNTSQENKYTRINLPKILCTCFKLFHFFYILVHVIYFLYHTCRHHFQWAADHSPWPGRSAHEGQERQGQRLCPGWSAESAPCQDPADRKTKWDICQQHVVYEGENDGLCKAHLSHGWVISLVGVQFVLEQLSQCGIVLVLPDGRTRLWTSRCCVDIATYHVCIIYLTRVYFCLCQQCFMSLFYPLAERH